MVSPESSVGRNPSMHQAQTQPKKHRLTEESSIWRDTRGLQAKEPKAPQAPTIRFLRQSRSCPPPPPG